MITNAVSRPPHLHHHWRVTRRHAATSDFAGALWNARATPFTWTKTADQILAKANRKKTSNADH